MVKEIIILRESGIPLFHYSVSGEKRLDELVAGFLSAMGGFVEQVSDQQIKVIAFAESKFVWERKGDLYFIALISNDDSAEIYRAILQNLADSFVSKYYNILRKEILSPKEFFQFTDTVELTLQKFDGIPGLARRYKTGLLPLDKLRPLKVTLAEIESRKDVLRGAVLTNDSHIVVSNFRAYEMEALLDQMKNSDFETEMAEPRMVVHTSLEPVTSFYIHPVNGKCISAFVVRAGKENTYYEELVKPLLTLVLKTSFDDMKKIHPKEKDEYTGFYDHDIIIPTGPVTKSLNDAKEIFSEMSSTTQNNVVQVLRKTNGKRTISEIQEETNLTREAVTEAIAGLVTKGLVHIVELFPVLGEKDDRFAAYLEVIGIPKRDYDIVNTVWKYCTGGFSLREISEKTEIQSSRVVEVLRALGNNVTWQQERRLEHDRPNN
ncbi:MAG: hypothetical protein P1Q69_12260 [Candidatus Thorarchaeota archaeon]|nr:hypothetical protein [Candidatus Thorarchaeota archaeon]